MLWFAYLKSIHFLGGYSPKVVPVIILYVLAELDSAKVDMPLITTNRQMK
jgi:hypothetical protein